MKKLLLTLALLTLATAAMAATHYKVYVHRVDDDLYKTNDGVYIETEWCYHYSYGEDAILKWDGEYSYDNKIIFDDESTCKVKRVWR